MKKIKILIVMLTIFSSYNGYSQSHEPYIYLEAGGGSHSMSQGALDVIFCKNNLLSLTYCTASIQATNVPSDFNTLYNAYNTVNSAAINANNNAMSAYNEEVFADILTIIGIFFLPSPPTLQPTGPVPQPFPEQTLNMYGLSYGKVFFSRTPCIRFIARAGIAAGTMTTPCNFVHEYYSGYTYYSYSFQKTNVMGLVVNPVMELSIGRSFGFSFGPYLNINTASSLYGVEGSMLLGRIRCKKDPYYDDYYH